METRTYNILVAEDESFQRLALYDILSICDYDGKHHIYWPIFVVVAVENGRLALEALRNPDHDFDLVLLDLNMPEVVSIQL